MSTHQQTVEFAPLPDGPTLRGTIEGEHPRTDSPFVMLSVRTDRGSWRVPAEDVDVR